MKNDLILGFGKLLMKLQPLTICIVDDVETYFNEGMLNFASVHGQITFERWSKVDKISLKNLVSKPRDIVILDIKGIVDPAIAKDGFDIANYLMKNTPSFIVTTSAHKFKLQNINNYGDYVITDRLMTPLDFVEELNSIIDVYIKMKLKPYKKLLFRIGFTIAKFKLF